MQRHSTHDAGSMGAARCHARDSRYSCPDGAKSARFQAQMTFLTQAPSCDRGGISPWSSRKGNSRSPPCCSPEAVFQVYYEATSCNKHRSPVSEFMTGIICRPSSVRPYQRGWISRHKSWRKTSPSSSSSGAGCQAPSGRCPRRGVAVEAPGRSRKLRMISSFHLPPRRLPLSHDTLVVPLGPSRQTPPLLIISARKRYAVTNRRTRICMCSR